MNFGNEQMIKTFEQLFHLRMKSPSIDPSENPPKKSRLFYRINREKLQKYHHEHPFTSNKAPTIVEYPLKPTILLRKTIGTQTQSHSSSSNSLQTSSSVSYVSSDEMERPSSNCRVYIREMLGDDIE